MGKKETATMSSLNHASRGGAKPRMMANSTDLPIEVAGVSKSGMYEKSLRGEAIARRVELPHWLGLKAKELGAMRFLALLAAGELKAPPEEIGESRGHVYLNPEPGMGLEGPAVGLDEAICEKIERNDQIKRVQFHVYAPGHRLVGIWQIEVERFKSEAKEVRTKASFMPQRMVELAKLKPRVER